jgi:ubiquinone/menaquinone biosynthesis C-methylase UbiE/uncharacterized protein YbaR (Trm112 family)
VSTPTSADRVRVAAWFGEPKAPAAVRDLSALRDLLACPACRGELDRQPEQLACRACRAVYEVRDDIPMLLPPDGAASSHKEQQASFFDEADPEFEVSRPHGTPWLYRWLLSEKFRRSLAALDFPPGAAALTVCGGSGMDAEFLARAGFEVVASDLSFEAARRTRQRALRHRLPIVPVVADVEALPFRDASVDLVYVHDGLHHLEAPAAGLGEMLRVSKAAVSINEPARAQATLLATRLRLAEHYEEAGNFIARLDPAWLAATVTGAGFEIVKRERYAMVYRHVPGRVARLLSEPGLRELTRAALGGFNAVAGGVGNKLTLQAVRRDRPGAAAR